MTMNVPYNQLQFKINTKFTILKKKMHISALSWFVFY